MIDFNINDVRTVAKAVVENWVDYYAGGNYRDMVRCRYCYQEVYDIGDKDCSHEIEHKLDCPMLVARDLLTTNTGRKSNGN